MRLRLTSVLCLVGPGLAALYLLVGCSGTVSRDEVRSATGNLTGVTVAGTVGEAPEVRIAAPLKVSATKSDIVVTGTGPPVTVGRPTMLHLTMYDARTGAKAASTHDPGETALVVKDTDETLFPVLSAALAGQPQGSRIAMTVAAEDAYGETGAPDLSVRPGDPLVLVADVVSVPPAELVDGPGDVPDLTERVAGAPPGEVTVVPLAEGDGPRARAESLVTVDYQAQAWGETEPFVSSYAKEPMVLPIGIANGAVDQALVGVRRGSRLLVLVPAGVSPGGLLAAAPPGAALAVVVDLRGVS